MSRFLFFFVAINLTLCVKLSFAYELDTLNGNIIITKGNQVTLIEFPIASFNVESQKVSYKSKYGSFHFKRRGQKNRNKSQLVFLSKDSLKIKDGDVFITLKFDTKDNASLEFQVSEGNELAFSLNTLSDELFFGGGVRFDKSILNNSTYINFAQENGIGRGDKPLSFWTKLLGIVGSYNSTYYPVPFFCSNMGRAFFMDTENLFFADFLSQEVQIKLFSNKMKLIFFESNKDFMHLIGQFNLLNGRGTAFPDWAMGTILGVQGGTMEVEEKFNKLKRNGAGVDALWVQDWVGKHQTKFGSRLNWSWQMDTSCYPSIDELKQNTNTKVLGYINPFFEASSTYAKVGLNNGYLLMNESNKSGCFDFGGIKGYMLDVFNKDAQKWMKEIITRNLIDQGFDGWMTDFGEWYEGASMLKGEDAHNRYINQWIQLNSELISQNERELFFFHRAGVKNVASHTQFQWYGDQTVNYGLNDGLPSVISAMQSSGFSGLPPGHSDIGGYTALRFWFVPKLQRTEQLIHDWMRLEAFTPVFRTHEGLNPNDNLQVYSSDSLAKAFVFYSDINKALKPYFKKYLELYRKNGFPIFRHPVMMHDSNLSDYSVYIGDDIVLIFDAKDTDQIEGFFGFFNEDHRVSVFIRKESLALQLLSAFLTSKKIYLKH